MRYIDIKEPGDATVMTVAHSEPPAIKSDEILIKVAYAGVNRPDVIQRLGFYPPPADASPILGLEVSGTVVAVGSATARFKEGDKVCALVNGGGYAEYVNAPERQCLPIPVGLTLSEAAALPETCFTVWTNVFDRGELKADEVLLIHGGASGIGTTALQMAKAIGAKVIVTASSEAKCKACTDLGAFAAINYQHQDFVERVKELTQGQGADVILDMVGGHYIQRNIDAAAIAGRIINIAYLQGSQAEVNFMPIMLKRLTLTGSTLRPQSAKAKAIIAAQLAKYIWPLIALGQIKPLIAAEFNLEDVAKAHQLMESNELIGKIVLKL